MIFQEKANGADSGAGYDKNKKVQHSVISSDLTIRGDLESTGDITIDGAVEGNIKCRTLILGEEPVIKSSIEADTVRICGVFSGDVRARKVVLTKTAQVSGDIFHECLEVEEGASLEGRLGRLKKEKANANARKAARAAETDGKEDEDNVTEFKPAESAAGND